MSFKRTKRSVKLLSGHPFLAFSFKSSSTECNNVNLSSQPSYFHTKGLHLPSLTHPNYQSHLSLAPELMVQHAAMFHRDCNHNHHHNCASGNNIKFLQSRQGQFISANCLFRASLWAASWKTSTLSR